MLVKRFQCDAGTFDIGTVMQGQSQLVWYDPLAQIALQPSLRDGTIMCYKDSGVEGMFAEIQAMISQDKRTVKTNPYYWTEYCEPTTLAITLAAAGSVGAAGAQVTVALDKSDYSRGGKYSPPKVGYRGYIKEINQVVNITATTKTTAGSHTVGLTPINGEILDLTQFANYTLVMDTLRMYKKGDRNCITGSGFVKNPPALRKGYIQKFEDMVPISEDELDGYAYDKEFKLFKGIDANGKKVDMWGLPEIQAELMARLKDNKIINSLWGRRDDVLRQGFDGLIPTADSQGMFSRRYDPGDGVSLKSMLFNMIKALRKVNGCTDYILLHDFGFKFDWNDAMAALIKASEIGKNYQLFGLGGNGGTREISWYDYNTFEAYGYKFTPKLIDTFDNRRYGAYQENFALMMPGCTFQDTNGNDVSPVTFVNIEGAEQAKQDRIWPDDTRERGCRDLNVFVKTAYGMEIHCASKMGTIRKATC